MSINDNENHVGRRLLSELARQRMTGAFFNFSQRRELREIDDRVALRARLAKWGFGQIDTTGSEKQIIEALNISRQPGPLAMLFFHSLDILTVMAELLCF